MKIDKQLIRQRFAQRFASYHKHAVVQKEMAKQLASMIANRKNTSEVFRGMEIGIGTGFLSTRLLAKYPGATWFFNDLVPEASDWVMKNRQLENIFFLAGDAESVPYPEQLDLLASGSAMQWFEDIPAFLARAHAALKPGGLLALGTFGPDNMREVRHIAGGGLHYPSPPCLEQWLREAGFHDIRLRAMEHKLFFQNATAVLRHMRETGVNAITASIWTPRHLLQFCEDYERLFREEDGTLPLSYHAVLLTATR